MVRWERVFRGTVTWVSPVPDPQMPQSAVADRWLSTAPSPDANTAAIHLPRIVIAMCPTA